MVAFDTFGYLNDFYSLKMDIIKFVKYVEDNLSIQEEIKDCKSGPEFFLLLKKYRFENIFDEIKSRSRDLSANYWPWADKFRADRKKYFDLDVDLDVDKN